MLRALYANTQSCVLVGGKRSTWVPVVTGVRQGCVLSPLLFLLFINDLAPRLAACDAGIAIDGGGKLSVLLFADDIVLLAQNKKQMQRMLAALSSYAVERRFLFNSVRAW